ncbi:hypothetical protein B7R22_05250 [Subtercola boreus]|uniref:Helix-turn-helix domain-containing protein n=1 Tax=Subtercola boreus TaxID=120213 RepID=A0A3E0W4F2_9MICO|nr:helix-turn-helix domain-containing protein [Subtercola boreus]RFA16007.1 hypothetical protein B7R22_05250 [Subtercola boreus]
MAHIWLLTESEVASSIGFAVGTLRNWRGQGKGPAFVKIGSAVRYRPEDIETWVTLMVNAP